MNELRKYATFSIDMIGEPIRINSMFSMGRARIFYMGPNPNRSIIEGEVAKKLATTIPGTPIIGLYDYDKEDFEGHGDGQAAYGFVPLEPHPEWVKINDNGIEREFLEVDVVVWDGRFEEAKSILKEQKALSMELNPTTLSGTIVKMDDGHTYYKISNAEFAGITVLGEDVEPCFKGAQFLTAYSNMVSAYARYIESTQENEEGGIKQMDNIEEKDVEIVEEEVVEPEINTEVEATETESEVEEVVEETAEEIKEEVEEPVEIVEEQPIEEAPIEETEFACGKEEEKEEECPECGKNPCECSCGKKKTYSEEEYAELEAKYESIKEELDAAREALKKYSRNEKLEIINKFSTKLEDEDIIANLTEKVDELTKEEIKSELGNALADQITAEEVIETETSETNFSLNFNLKDEISNTCWDLVKNYKNRK